MHQLQKELEKEYPTISLTPQMRSEMDDNFSARDSIFFEGFSLVRNCFLASDIGHQAMGMFIYDIKEFSNTQRTKYYYALNGREGPGVLEQLKGVRLSHNILLIPLEKIELMKDFLSYWKINFHYIPLLLPERMAKQEILARLSA